MRLRSALALPAVALALALTASPAHAVPPTPIAAAPLFADGYWHGFVEHWLGKLKQQNGVVMVALAVGAASLLIITRGKWMK